MFLSCLRTFLFYTYRNNYHNIFLLPQLPESYNGRGIGHRSKIHWMSPLVELNRAILQPNGHQASTDVLQGNQTHASYKVRCGCRPKSLALENLLQ